MRWTGENHNTVVEHWMGQVKIGCKVRTKLSEEEFPLKATEFIIFHLNLSIYA